MTDVMQEIEDWANAGNVPSPVEQRLKEIEKWHKGIEGLSLTAAWGAIPWLISQVREVRAEAERLRTTLDEIRAEARSRLPSSLAAYLEEGAAFGLKLDRIAAKADAALQSAGEENHASS